MNDHMTTHQAAQLLVNFREGLVGDEMREALRLAIIYLNAKSPKDEGLICRIAGNVAGGMSGTYNEDGHIVDEDVIVRDAVSMARKILAEVRRG